MVEDVALTGIEDGLIETTLTAVGPSGPGRFTFGKPDHGTVAVADAERGVEPTSDGAWGIEVRYRPDRDYHGSDRFTYTACDRDGACATATVTTEIAGVNDAPAPIADRHALTAGETAIIDVAANDRDVDGDPLSVRVVSPPRRGSVSVVGDRLEYRAPRGFIGEDVLSYSVTDPGGLSGTASLSLTVLAAEPEPEPTPTTLAPADDPPEDPPEPLPATPDPPLPEPTPPEPPPPDPPPAANQVPVAVDDAGPGFVTAEDVAFTTADVTANDSDADDAVVPASATVVSSVTHGVLVRNGDGRFVYTPDPEFFGTDSFRYTHHRPVGGGVGPGDGDDRRGRGQRRAGSGSRFGRWIRDPRGQRVPDRERHRERQRPGSCGGPVQRGGGVVGDARDAGQPPRWDLHVHAGSRVRGRGLVHVQDHGSGGGGVGAGDGDVGRGVGERCAGCGR